MSNNTQPLDSKLFNIEHAKAGAPFGMACGWNVQIFKWDGRGPCGPIIGCFGSDDRPASWHETGEFSVQQNPRLALVMLPLGYIDGQPVFAGDEVEDQGPDRWHLGTVQPKDRDFTTARWPVPTTNYPVTQLCQAELYEYVCKADIRFSFVAAANAALRHAVDNGYLVIPEAKK